MVESRVSRTSSFAVARTTRMKPICTSAQATRRFVTPRFKIAIGGDPVTRRPLHENRRHRTARGREAITRQQHRTALGRVGDRVANSVQTEFLARGGGLA